MDKILKTLGLRREGKLTDSVTRDGTDSDYRYRTNKSVTYDCKRLSASYTLLSETSGPYNNKHFTSASTESLNGNCVDETDDKKSNGKTYSLNSKQKSPKSLKSRMLSKFILRKNRVFKINPGGNRLDNKPNMLWYGDNSNVIPMERQVTDIKIKYSLTTERENHQKEMAKTIADELKLRTHTRSLSLKNGERHFILTETDCKQK